VADVALDPRAPVPYHIQRILPCRASRQNWYRCRRWVQFATELAVGAMSGLPPLASELRTSLEGRFVPGTDSRFTHCRPTACPAKVIAQAQVWAGCSTLSSRSASSPITNRNDTRDSTEGRSMSMRGEQRGNSIHIRRSMRERSRTLARTRRNKQGHSRHSSRTPVRRSNRSPGHRRRRWTLFPRSPHQQLVRLRDRHPNHPATPELVMVSPRQ
jgi:hypothetical protein